jgi:hypothetical protein
LRPTEQVPIADGRLTHIFEERIMKWTILPQSSEILAVHAALLHTGHILYFGGDEHDKGHHDTAQIDATRLFDCANLAVTRLPSPQTDVFCCGHAFLPNGRLLVAGGTEAFPQTIETLHHESFTGSRDTWIFDPRTRAWKRAAFMIPEPGHEAANTGGGRWYPTLVTLPGGRILAVSGGTNGTDTRLNNDVCEVFNPVPKPRGKWTQLGDQRLAINFYPRMHLLPNGEIFCSQLAPSGQGPNRHLAFRPGAGRWRDVCEGLADPMFNGLEASSVLLPLLPSQDYRPRVLRVGGQQPMMIDLGAPVPNWQPTAPRALAGSPVRRHANAVLLPTGDVFVCGGISSTTDNSDASAALTPEIYSPAGNAWGVAAAAAVPRNYHSVALLMPDGRVWTAGSNLGAQQSYAPPGSDNRELRIEIFEPDYINANRPRITHAPATASWGQGFTVRTPVPNAIKRVAIIRNGSVTHSFDSDQRYVGLTFTVTGEHTIKVKAPPNGRIAPPGWYLLFLLDDQAIPSVGAFIRLGSAQS